MEYFIKRGEQKFGPYGLADLQKYVQSGNLVLEDLAQSEGMADWVPLSQVLGNIPALAMATSGPGSSPVTAAEPELVPLPFNLHWLVVLILGLLTRQLFNLLWALVQGNWARKLSGDNKPLVLVAMYPAGMIAGILTVALARGTPGLTALGGLFMIGGAIVYLFGVFSIKAAMEEYYTSVENIGLQLSGVMTFFFSTVYIQYHINSIARWKKTGVLK
jgi:GYF domain 2